MYRKLLKLAYTFPNEAKRIKTIRQIQGTFRTNSGEVDQKKVAHMLDRAESTLSYLKIVTPRTATSIDTQQGITRLTFESSGSNVAKQVAGKKNTRPVTNWTGSNLDPDSVSRHQHTLKRAGFKDNASAKGIF